MAEGYDHSYFFVQTFLEKHVRFHAEALGVWQPLAWQIEFQHVRPTVKSQRNEWRRRLFCKAAGYKFLQLHAHQYKDSWRAWLCQHVCSSSCGHGASGARLAIRFMPALPNFILRTILLDVNITSSATPFYIAPASSRPAHYLRRVASFFLVGKASRLKMGSHEYPILVNYLCFKLAQHAHRCEDTWCTRLYERACPSTTELSNLT